MSANYVARELGYGATDQWGPFDEATNAAFEPLETFPARFEELITSVAELGFDAIDLWFGHLNCGLEYQPRRPASFVRPSQSSHFKEIFSIPATPASPWLSNNRFRSWLRAI